MFYDEWTALVRMVVMGTLAYVALILLLVKAEPTLLLHDQTEPTDGDRNRQREGWPPAARSGGEHDSDPRRTRPGKAPAA